MTEQSASWDQSWIEIDSAAYSNNLRFFRDELNRAGHVTTDLGVVLKGNAYGHGLAEIAALTAHEKDIKVIYVFRAQEARQICETIGLGQRIVVLGPPPADWGTNPFDERIEWVVSSGSQLEQISKLMGRVPHLNLSLHVHLDTGLGREGFSGPQVRLAIDRLLGYENLLIKGLMSHFANTEDVTRQDYAKQQLQKFIAHADEITSICEAKKRPRPERHIAASAACLVLEQSHFDVVRIGIGAYGLWPSNETRLGYVMSRGQGQANTGEGLKPVMTWRVRSQCLKTLDRGDFVGYGCTFRCSHPTRVAVFPVGYADGYVRCLTGHAHVLVEGQRCPIIGRVMMNHIVVSVPEEVTSIANSDSVVATLLGQDRGELITADDLAQWSGTINYEVTTRIRESLTRQLIDSAQRSGAASEI